MSQVHGSCDAKFAEVRSLFQKFVLSGEELGASIAVNINGRNVVDLWGGYVDGDRSRPWEEDTIVNVYSSTKTLISLSVLVLVDRGLLDVNQSVSYYWPEFVHELCT